MTKHQWKSTPGPIKIMIESPEKTHIEPVDQSANGHAAIALAFGPQRDGNARLLAASYNAFDSAATRLNLNAVELAERMQDGTIADLVEALKTVVQTENDFEEESRNFNDEKLIHFSGLVGKLGAWA